MKKNLSFERGNNRAGESVQFHFVFVNLFSVGFIGILLLVG